MSPSETISPTAHYTSYVWVRNGLSDPALASPLDIVEAEEGPRVTANIVYLLAPYSLIVLITET